MGLLLRASVSEAKSGWRTLTQAGDTALFAVQKQAETAGRMKLGSECADVVECPEHKGA